MKRKRKIWTVYHCRRVVACFLAFFMTFVTPAHVAFAAPNNPDVVAGSAGVAQAGNTTTVNVNSASAVINWDSLDTSSSEILQFLKASGNFAVLNRVIKGGATQFDGSLFGNQGHIIIVNPNGIVFGPTALVQAHKFTSSALDITNADFMNGVYKFTGDGMGKVINYGNISAEQVALIGKQVLNAGVIRSPGGYVLMAVGDKVCLGQEGSEVVVEIDGITVPDPTEGLGNVINEGTINAQDGKIVLAAGDTFSRAIDGLDSLALVVEDGVGRVGQFGTLNADGTEGDGGSITLTAGQAVTLGPDSLTTANAGADGDGGEVIVYSPGSAVLGEDALIEAKGASLSGDGGFVEISGKELVDVKGSVNTSAPKGKAGTFLIDPHNVIIDDTGASDLDASTISAPWLEGQLASNNIEVRTDTWDATGEKGWIEVRDPIEWNSQNSLGLVADNYIKIFEAIDNGGTGDLNFHAKKGNVELLYHPVYSTSPDLVYLSTWGNLNITSPLGGIAINGNVYSYGNMLLDCLDYITLHISSTANNWLQSGGDMTITAQERGIFFGGNVFAGTSDSGDLVINSMKTKIESVGNLSAFDNVTINGDLELLGGTGILFGNRDQWIGANNGTLTTNGYVRKLTEGELFLFGGGTGNPAVDLKYVGDGPGASTCLGDLWILGEGDVQIADDVTTYGPFHPYFSWEGEGCMPTGGVAIISKQGKVYTEGSDALNVNVTGTSDHKAQYGIDLVRFDKYTDRTTDWWPQDPYDLYIAPRAAIIVQSSDDLKIGENAVLTARGNYYGPEYEIGDLGPVVVDDRPAIGFLDTDNTTIGGHIRDEGQPFDLAVYLASTGTGSEPQQGNVLIDGIVTVEPCIYRMANTHYNYQTEIAPATVVADAYYNVEFLDDFMEFLSSGEFQPFRMEVCTRITEWLSQAIANNRLPFADDTAVMEELLGMEEWPGDDYVLRGAGFGNPVIVGEEFDPEYPGSIGRAWVLEDPPPPPPQTAAAPLAKPEFPVIEGCPVLLEAVALEIGTTKEALNIAIENALALDPDMQPCEVCAKLVNYARVLSDIDGTRMAAVLQVFNEIAPADVPFTPELTGSIATAFAAYADDIDMPQYATALEYIDAFTGYVAVMNELDAPVEDPVAFVMGKYGAPVTGSDNANIASYIEIQLAALGG
jgi:filamentous hemagglutinin family protein